MKPNQKYYCLSENQEVSGPYSLEELKALRAEGIMSDTTYVAGDGYESWILLSDELAEEHPPAESRAAASATPPTADAAAGLCAEPPLTLDSTFDLRPNTDRGTAAPIRNESVAEPPDWPWEPQPELVSRADAYFATQRVTTFACRCDEMLNTLARKDSRASGYAAKLHICPDLVTISGKRSRLNPVWLLAHAFSLAWSAVWQFVFFILSILTFNPMAVFFNFFAFGMTIVQAVATFILAPLSVYWLRWRAPAIAERVRREPKSSYAIKKRFQFTPLAPRFWGRGDVAQVIRVDSRGLLTGTRRLLLLVQDKPMGKKAGWLESLWPNALAFRRVYVVRLSKSEADAAAQRVAAALGLAVIQGRFSHGRLILQLPGSPGTPVPMPSTDEDRAPASQYEAVPPLTDPSPTTFPEPTTVPRLDSTPANTPAPAPPMVPEEEEVRVPAALPGSGAVTIDRDASGNAEAARSTLPPPMIEAGSFPDLMPVAEMYAKGGVAVWAALAGFVLLFLTAHSFVGFKGAFVCLLLAFGGYAFSVLAQLNQPCEWIQEETPEPQQRNLLDALREVTAKAGLPLPRIAIDRSLIEINAMTYGLSRRSASILVTAAFLEHVKPTPSELEAVLGHEMSHVAHGDCVLFTLLRFPVWAMGKIRGLLGFAQRLGWGFLQGFIEAGAGFGLVGLVLVLMLVGFLIYLGVMAALLTVAILVTAFFVYAFEREREYLADLYGSSLVGTPIPMQSVLAKLELASERISAELKTRARNLREGEEMNLVVPPPPQAPDIREFVTRALGAPASELHSGIHGEFLADHPVTTNRLYFLQHPDRRKRALTSTLKRLEVFVGGGETNMSAQTVRSSLLIGALTGLGPGLLTLSRHRLLEWLGLLFIPAGAFAFQYLAARLGWSGATVTRAGLLASYAAATILLLSGILLNPSWMMFPLMFLLTFALFFLIATKTKLFKPSPTEVNDQPQ